MLRALVWILVLALIPLAVTFFMARPLLAAACPVCFGLSKVADGVYMQSAANPAASTRVMAVLNSSEQRVGKFYGGLKYVPRLLVCADDACYQHIGGPAGSGVGSMGSFALVVSPEAGDVLVSEALSQVELHGRVGMWKMAMGAVPTWFDEGTAALAAEDLQDISPVYRHQRDRCLVDPGEDLPAGPMEWRQRSAMERDLAPRAACKVDRWMIAHGGSTAISGLLDKVGQGQDFTELFH